MTAPGLLSSAAWVAGTLASWLGGVDRRGTGEWPRAAYLVRQRNAPTHRCLFPGPEALAVIECGCADGHWEAYETVYEAWCAAIASACWRSASACLSQHSPQRRSVPLRTPLAHVTSATARRPHARWHMPSAASWLATHSGIWAMAHTSLRTGGQACNRAGVRRGQRASCVTRHGALGRKPRSWQGPILAIRDLFPARRGG
jgi:hypothetical protein